MTASFIALLACAYVGFLFAIAFITERLPYRFKERLRTSPVIYTLSIAVYCTSWTFYGAVGSAASRGLEFITIYLGPTLVFLIWWLIIKKMVRICRAQKATSIADFLSGRYGKSSPLSALATLVALIGVAPYIALQLKAITTSFSSLTLLPSQQELGQHSISLFETGGLLSDVGLWTALGMIAFVWLFGARNLEASEQHRGIIAAIAVESLVKLFAILAVGIFSALFLLQLQSAPQTPLENAALIARLNTASQTLFSLEGSTSFRWITLLFLSGAAILCLPRQFQVMVVENQDEKHLATASWLFPSYLFLLCLFTLPIALTGMIVLPEGNPDLYVLSVPLAFNNQSLALLAFIGGLSSATSMVIIASLALAIMISNHWIMPLLIRLPNNRIAQMRDVTSLLIAVRQLSILLIIATGYSYYYLSKDSGSLAATGLIAFTGVAQFLPALIGALYWRSASEHGAIAGLSVGFISWLYCLLVPTLLPSALPTSINPQLFFEHMGWDPIVGTTFFSLSLNALAFIFVSINSQLKPLEQLQAAFFVDAARNQTTEVGRVWNRVAAVEDLYALAQRFIGTERTHRQFRQYARDQGHNSLLPQLDAGLIPFVEGLLTSAIGAASARVLVANIAEGDNISMEEVIKILDETHQVIEYSHKLEQKSTELEETAAQLRLANEQLRRVDAMKDDFLSQISHELRTPMTSLRSFTDILLNYELEPSERQRYIRILFEESQRLTGLLDDILRISRLEQGLDVEPTHGVDAQALMLSVIESMSALAKDNKISVVYQQDPALPLVFADERRLRQIFVNLLSNAYKYNSSSAPWVKIYTSYDHQQVTFHVKDNGEGFDEEMRARLFTKFARSWRHVASHKEGSGLGLAISKQTIVLMQGDLWLNSPTNEDMEGGGAEFCLTLKRG